MHNKTRAFKQENVIACCIYNMSVATTSACLRAFFNVACMLYESYLLRACYVCNSVWDIMPKRKTEVHNEHTSEQVPQIKSAVSTITYKKCLLDAYPSWQKRTKSPSQSRQYTKVGRNEQQATSQSRQQMETA